MQNTRLVLVPYNRSETITVRVAAERAGVSQSTIRNWCRYHAIGRQIVGGPFSVSKVALAMLLNDDLAALRLYHSGDRISPVVMAYFDREAKTRVATSGDSVLGS